MNATSGKNRIECHVVCCWLAARLAFCDKVHGRAHRKPVTVVLGEFNGGR